MKRLSTMLFLAFIGLTSLAAEQEFKRFPDENWLAWLHIDYPSNFRIDPKSLQGESKWWARFVAPGDAFSIEVMSHGYCSDILLQQEGYKTPESYILKNVIPGEPSRTSHSGYDRLIRVDAASVTVVFLESNAEWGKCYELLTFKFPDGGYESYRETIMKVIESAAPSFSEPAITN